MSSMGHSYGWRHSQNCVLSSWVVPNRCPYTPECVEAEFSEVRRCKRPAKRGSVPSRAAWQHHFGAETPRPSSVRCSVAYQGVATRNAPTTREILAHRSGTKRRSRNGHLAEVDMVTWQRRGSLCSLRVMGITAFGRSSLFSPLPFYRAARSPCWLAGGPGRLERGYAELRIHGVLGSSSGVCGY